MDIMEMLRWLTDEEKARFAKLEHVFESEGWQQHIKPHLAARAEQLRERGAAAASWEENRMALGARYLAEELHNLEAQVLTEFLAIAEQRRQASAAATEEEHE